MHVRGASYAYPRPIDHRPPDSRCPTDANVSRGASSLRDRRRRLWLGAVGIWALVAAQSQSAHAQTACVDTKCLTAKLDAIAKEEADLFACFVKAAGRRRGSGFGRCVQRAAGRYIARFGRAGECSGEDLTCGCLAENCALAVRLALPEPGPSRCAAARLRAAARKAVGTLRCNTQAMARGTVIDQRCIDKVDAKYQAAFARPTGCTGDRTAIGAIIEAACVTEVGAKPTGGDTVCDVCTSHACDGVDARGE
jgi:hypothetical protein